MKAAKFITIVTVILLVFIVPTGVHGRVFFQGEFVDIPSSRVLPHLAISGDMAMHAYLSSGWTHTKGSQNISIGLFDWSQIDLTLESEQQFQGDVRVKIFNESRYLPAITIGVQNITGKKDISQFGKDFSEYGYFSDQNNSFYAVFTKNWTQIPGLRFTTNIGAGNHRFVGTEKNSEKLHGIFAGIAMWAGDRLCFTAEEDGKDLNAGMLLQLSRLLTLRFAVTDIEKAFDPGATPSSPNPGQHTKIAIGLSYMFNQLRPELSRKEQLIDSIREERTQNIILQDELESIRARRKSVEKDLEILKQYLQSDDMKQQDTEIQTDGDQNKTDETNFESGEEDSSE